MSRKTIRVLDLLCAAGNWQESINNVSKEIEGYGDSPQGIEGRYKKQAEDEVQRWSLRRDKIVNKLRPLLDELTEHERQHLTIRPKPNPNNSDPAYYTRNPRLGTMLQEIGITVSWA
jgi:hypothetical protein